MLGDERFTDHPQRVCPVVAAFLRGYNDAVGEARRQELFAVAAAVVDSRTDDRQLREDRAAALLVLAIELWRHRGRRFRLPPAFPHGTGYADVQAAGMYAGRIARRDPAAHDRAMALVEDLVAREPDAPQPVEAPAPVVPA